MKKHYVGIDLGGTNIAVGIVDEDYNIIYKGKIKTSAELGFKKVIQNMGEIVNKCIEESGVDKASISSVGLGSPGFMDSKTGLLVYANNMGWRNVPIHDELKQYVDYPIYIKNDADAAAFGETLAGAAKDYDNAIMITLGTGVGGGVILNNKIFSGCDDMGGELGHTKLVFNGEECTCGQKGCLEAYASATAFIRDTKRAMEKNPDSIMHSICGGNIENANGRTAFDAARQGDAVALKVVEDYIDYLAAGLSSFAAVFRPDVFIIGGGLSGEGDYLINPLNERILHYTYSADLVGAPKAIKAKLGNDAGIIGAALLELS